MKFQSYFSFALITLLAGGCNRQKQSDVVSQRYIHKYGYDVSKEEWSANQFPGQIVTTLKSGVTIVASYDGGVLHGQTTYTYPHSQTLESLNLYDRGQLVKKVAYDIRGLPIREDEYISPTHRKTKFWFTSGSPMSFEETADNALIEGEYFTLKNELESRVSNGTGIRVLRDSQGLLLAKEWIEGGQPVSKETFFPNGSPHMIIHIKGGKLDGEKRVFAMSGEPISIEQWSQDRLNGPCTYFQNGVKYLEITYRNGLKHGIERHYIDGESLSQETQWLDNQRHGPTTYYADGIAKMEWYYNNELVSKAKFDELVEREQAISAMHQRTQR